MDATAEDLTLENGTTEKGIGNGFSAFLGCSNVNTIWIASLNAQKHIVDEQLISFAKGDCIIIPYGTIHAGDRNRTGATTYKVFSDVSSTRSPDNTSQLWVIPGKGYTKTKQTYQLDDSHDVTITVTKKRKRNS